MLFSLTQKIKRLLKEIKSLLKEINRLVNQGMTNTCLKVYVEKGDVLKTSILQI